ncbi:MAG: tyrosine-type recombinase/integrase [Rhodomicrobiaceae bacterium]
MANLTGRVTKSAVDRMAAGTILRDSELRGFGARRQIGAPIYFLQKRINGRLRWITIGTHGAPWTAESARREALRLLGQIAGGADPAPQREQPAVDATLAVVAPLFMEEHGPKLKPLTREKYQSVLGKHILPVLGELRVGDIKRRDVTRLHGQLARYPTIANYAVAVLSKCLTWCEEHGLRPERSNPCGRLKKYAENKRHRYLTADEYARLGAAIARAERFGAEDPFVLAALRLLILTGARLNEILTLKWSYVDLDRGLLILPDSKTGQKMIGLNGPAVTLLSRLPRLPDNPHVIPGRVRGAHLINLQKPWRRIRAEASLTDVRIHDLRHSFASVAAVSNASLLKIGKLLGHADARTTARYAHLTDASIVTLNENVGVLIAEAMGDVPSPRANLFHRRAGYSDVET